MACAVVDQQSLHGLGSAGLPWPAADTGINNLDFEVSEDACELRGQFITRSSWTMAEIEKLDTPPRRRPPKRPKCST